MTVQGWHAPAVNTSKHSSLYCQADLAYKAVIAAIRNMHLIRNMPGEEERHSVCWALFTPELTSTIWGNIVWNSTVSSVLIGLFFLVKYLLLSFIPPDF